MDEDNQLGLAHGQILMSENIDALRVRIDAALQVIKGEVDDPTQGVDYFGIIFSNTPLSIKVQELTRVIRSLDGVDSVDFIDAKLDDKTGALSFKFNIYSVYGQMEYDKTFEIIA